MSAWSPSKLVWCCCHFKAWIKVFKVRVQTINHLSIGQCPSNARRQQAAGVGGVSHFLLAGFVQGRTCLSSSSCHIGDQSPQWQPSCGSHPAGYSQASCAGGWCSCCAGNPAPQGSVWREAWRSPHVAQVTSRWWQAPASSSWRPRARTSLKKMSANTWS